MKSARSGRRGTVGPLVAVLVLAGCTSSVPGDTTEDPYVQLNALKAEPAAGLAPQAAVVIREVGGERFMNITGPEAAFYGHVYGVQSTPEEARTFFDRELRKLGWVPDLGPILSSGEEDGWGWWAAAQARP